MAGGRRSERNCIWTTQGARIEFFSYVDFFIVVFYTSSMSQRHFHLSRAQMGKLPDLDRWGFAIEEFPRFVPPHNNFLHTHDIVEMLFVRAGEGVHRLPNSQRPLKPGTLAIIHHHQAHGFESLTPSLNLINVYFDFNRLILPVLPSPLWEIVEPAFQGDIEHFARTLTQKKKAFFQTAMQEVGEERFARVRFEKTAEVVRLDARHLGELRQLHGFAKMNIQMLAESLHSFHRARGCP